MSVRRLDPVQPESFAFTPTNLVWAKETIRKYPEGKQASAVIPLLWRAQEQNEGWVSKPAMEYVAAMLGMSFIRVYEVATFYTMFQLSPVGRRAHVQVCGTTPCMLRGSEALMKVCRQRIHPEQHHLSSDGDFSWEEVECLGACVNAPMVQIWSDTYEDLTAETFATVLDGYANGRPPRPGPQNGRQFSAPEGELTSLTDKALYGKDRIFTRMEAPPPAPPPSAPPLAQPAAAAPPSDAGKPQPSAHETAPAVKSPSPVKTAEAPAALAAKAQKAEATVTAEKTPSRVAEARTRKPESAGAKRSPTAADKPVGAKAEASASKRMSGRPRKQPDDAGKKPRK
jgi:NADH-quinone oxidoreductase subunit E